MYKTKITRVPDELGESIEEKLRKATANKETIEMKDAPIYTERKQGVLPQFDIRTDKQELALDATNKYNATIRAKMQGGIEDPFKHEEETNKE